MLSGELQLYAANPVMESTVSSSVNPSNPAAPQAASFEIIDQLQGLSSDYGRCILKLKWPNTTVSTENVTLRLAAHLRALSLRYTKTQVTQDGDLTINWGALTPNGKESGPPTLALVKGYVALVVDPNIKPTDNIDIMQIQRAFTNAIAAVRPDWRSTDVTLTMHEGRVIKSIDFVVGFVNQVFHYSHEVNDLERLVIKPVEQGKPFEPDPEEFPCVILNEGPRHGEIDFGESDEGVRLDVEWRDGTQTIEHVSKRGAKLFGWIETPEADVTDPNYQARRIIELLEIELGVKGATNVFRKALEHAKQARADAVVPLVEAPPEMAALLDDVLKDLRYARSAFKPQNGIIQLVAITQTKINNSDHYALKSAKVKSVKLLTASTDFPNGAIRFEVEVAGQFVEVVKAIDE